MTKPIEDTNNAAAIRTALDVPTTGALNTVGDAAQAAAETAAAKYTKPSTGIPASDLAAAAQTSLGKADSAIQDLAGMTAKFNAGTAPEKAAFQSSVSGGGRRYKLGGRCGLLASPIATATVAGALIFALPESIKIPAGSGGANSRIYYDVRVRRQVAAAAATNVIVRFGPANSNADQACGLLSLPITLNSDGRAFGSIDAASNTAVSYNSYGAINGATTAAAQDVTAGINFGVDQYLNIGISGTNGDQVSLIAYSFYLEV